MDIKLIKGLDVGMSKITCAGEVKYTKDPKHLTGSSGGRDYDFWSQFIVVEDPSDSIGIHITLEKNNTGGFSKGDQVKIWGGTLDSYKDKENKTQFSLKAYGEREGG